MDFTKIMNTTGLFLGGACCLLKCVDDGIKHAARESPVTLLSTGAILFPLSILIGIAVNTIFNEMGWQPSETRNLTTYFFTLISSTTLASAAAVGMGFTASLSTGLTVSLITCHLVVGIALIVLGAENIYSGTNHQVENYNF